MRVTRRLGLGFVAVLALVGRRPRRARRRAGRRARAAPDERDGGDHDRRRRVRQGRPVRPEPRPRLHAVVEEREDPPRDAAAAERAWRRAGSPAGFIPATENIATYTSSMSTLNVGADVGIYHDLALILRLPVILSWSQSLGRPQRLVGRRLAAPRRSRRAASSSASPSEPHAQRRRLHLASGLDWAIFNQQRDDTKPTWVIGVEGRVAVGTPLHACNADERHAAPVPRPATDTPRRTATRASAAGTTRSSRKTVWSRRFGYVEPYSGFWVQADFPTGGSDFGKWNPAQNLERTPAAARQLRARARGRPLRARASSSSASRPTSASRGRTTRRAATTRSSSTRSARRRRRRCATPNPAAYTAEPARATERRRPELGERLLHRHHRAAGVRQLHPLGVGHLAGGRVHQVHARRRVHLRAVAPHHGGRRVHPERQHQPRPRRAAASTATATVQGVPNPDHRDIIDLPGHRFSVDDTTIVDLYVMGIVMF